MTKFVKIKLAVDADLLEMQRIFEKTKTFHRLGILFSHLTLLYTTGFCRDCTTPERPQEAV